jgi:hypothetical protein
MMKRHLLFMRVRADMFLTGGYNNPLALKYYSQVSARPGLAATTRPAQMAAYHFTN